MFVRFDPFRDFDRAVSRPHHADGGHLGHHPIPMDAIRTDAAITVQFDLPGIDPDQVDLTVERRELRLRVNRDFSVEEAATVIAHERPSGSFSRTLHLTETLDPSGLDANFHNGVLTVTIPIAETAQPRKVSIGAGGPALIEAEATVVADSPADN